LCASIKLTIWLAINRSRTIDKNGSMAKGRISVPDLGIGNIFAIFLFFIFIKKFKMWGGFVLKMSRPAFRAV